MKNQFVFSLLLFCVACLCGCSSTGIRKLESAELSYYQALAKQLEANKADLATLRETAGGVDELAVREVTRLEGQLHAAKAIYSVREMLTAPAGANAQFVQTTRNKVLLYYLMETASAQSQETDVKVAEVKAFQDKLAQLEDQLLACAGNVIESEKLLHNHLNKGSVGNVQDVFSEVQRQLGAFDAEIKNADQKNPFIQSLESESKSVGGAVDKADKGLDKFMDVWTKLNKPDK